MPKLKMWTLLMGLIFAAITPVAYAQDENSQKSDDSKVKAAAAKPISAYRLEFTLSEIENGKKINTRSYTMVVKVGDWEFNKLRIGTRLPVASESGANRQFRYLDIGMNIDCRLLREQDGYLLLETAIDSSYISQASTRDPVTLNQPVIDQMKTSVSTMVSPGKPTVISSMDDPSSKRTYQIEVTATKVK